MPFSHGVFLKGEAQANIMDSKPILNIRSFGVCKITQVACVPATGVPWVNMQSTNLMIEGFPALIEDAVTFCAIGGIIKINNSGQGWYIFMYKTKMIKIHLRGYSNEKNKNRRKLQCRVKR